MMGKGEFAVFVAPRLRGLLNNRTIGGRKKRQPPQGWPKPRNRVQKNDKTARSGCGKNDSPPQGGAKIAQLGAEKRQNRTIGVRLKKKNGAERDRTDDL